MPVQADGGVGCAGIGLRYDYAIVRGSKSIGTHQIERPGNRHHFRRDTRARVNPDGVRIPGIQQRQDTKTIMKIDKSGKQLLKDVEGLSLTAYLDTGGQPTIGIGHLITNAEKESGVIVIKGEAVRYGQGITEQQCFDLLEQDIAIAEGIVNRLVQVPLKQNQFNALASFAFNVGEGQFATSTLVEMLNNQMYDRVPGQLKRWVMDDGKVVNGLVNRRDKEIAMWRSALA